MGRPVSTARHDAGRGCPACGYREAEVGEIDAERSALAGVCDVTGHRFDRIAYLHCGYAELYRDRTPRDLLDLFLG